MHVLRTHVLGEPVGYFTVRSFHTQEAIPADLLDNADKVNVRYRSTKLAVSADGDDAVTKAGVRQVCSLNVCHPGVTVL